MRQFLGFGAGLILSACAAEPPGWSVVDLASPERVWIDANAGRDTVCIGRAVGPVTIEHMRVIHAEVFDMRNGRHNTLLLTALAVATADADQVMEVRGDPGLDEVILDPSVSWTVSRLLDDPAMRRYTYKSGSISVSVDIPASLLVHIAPPAAHGSSRAESKAPFAANDVVGRVLDATPAVLELTPTSSPLAGIDLRNGQPNLALITPHTFRRASSDTLRIAGDEDDIVILDPRARWNIAAAGDEWHVTTKFGYDHDLTLIVPMSLRLVEFGSLSSQILQTSMAPPFPGVFPFVGSTPANTRVRMPYGGPIRFMPGQVSMIDGIDMTNNSPNTLILSSDELRRTPNRRATIHGDGSLDAVEFAEPELWEPLGNEPKTEPNGKSYRHYRLNVGGEVITLRIQADLKQPAIHAVALRRVEWQEFVDCKGQPVRLALPGAEARAQPSSE